MEKIFKLLARLSEKLETSLKTLDNLEIEYSGIQAVIASYTQDIGPFLFLPIEILDLTVRTKNILKGQYIDYIGDLIQLTALDLRKMSGMGVKSLNEIQTELARRGLKLKERK